MDSFQIVKTILESNCCSLSFNLKGVFFMGRAQGQKHNKGSLPQVPKNLKTDGKDVEYSEEFADHADLEAQARANAANQRVKNRNK